MTATSSPPSRATPAAPPAVARRTARIPAVEALVVVALAVLVQQLGSWGIGFIIEHEYAGDFVAHAKNAALSNELGIPWGHFLTYVLITAPCGACTDVDRILTTLPALVGLLLAAKFVLTWLVLRDAVGPRTLARPHARGRLAAVVGVALLLGLAFNLPFPNLYRGQLTPNQWHNTTTLALAPIAIGVFWAACRYLRRPGIGLAAMIAALGLVSIAAKPSFAMAFVPGFALLALLVPLERRDRAMAAGVVGVLVLGLGVQYAWMYGSESFAELRAAVQALRSQEPQEWGVGIAPFQKWSSLTPSIPASLLATIAFPLAALAARPRTVLRSRELQLAWALFGFGLLAFVLLDETGRDTGAANFRWGGIVTLYLLFMVNAAMLLGPGDPDRRHGRARDRFAWIVFGAHVASGLFALYIVARTGSYLHLTWHDTFDF